MEQKQVSFRELKARITIHQVLAQYGIDWLQKEKGGKELVGRCPIHKGDGGRTFHAAQGKFQCFSCKAKGDLIEFVIAMEEASGRNCTSRGAGLLLDEWFPSGMGEPATSSDKAASVKTVLAKPTQVEKEIPAVINPPLSFQLRLDLEHGYGPSRGVSTKTLAQFGAGLCTSKSKLFEGRFVIPLHNAAGELVGYGGRSVDGSEPKYRFPPSEKGFYKSRLVFNLHRVAGSSAVVVEGFFSCMRLHEAGLPAVGILGSSMSAEQEELLCQRFDRVALMFDGDEAGRKCTEDAARRLARRLWVRVVDLPDGKQPDDFAADELRSMVGLL